MDSPLSGRKFAPCPSGRAYRNLSPASAGVFLSVKRRPGQGEWPDPVARRAAAAHSQGYKQIGTCILAIYNIMITEVLLPQRY